MSEKFDAYHRWLAIPPQEQPPDHYRLLGLAKFESDIDVIDTAADRQMAHVRTYQSGKYAEASQKLLNEIAAARVVLLDAEKKSAYDAGLRERIKPLKQATSLATAQPLEAALPSPKPAPVHKPAPQVPAQVAVPTQVAASAAPKIDASKLAPLLFAAGAGLLVLLLAAGAGAWFIFGSSEEQVVIVDPGPTYVAPPVIPPVQPVDDSPDDVTPAPPIPPPITVVDNGKPPTDDPTPRPEQPDDPPSEPVDPVAPVGEPPAEEAPPSVPPASPISGLFAETEADQRAALPDEATQKEKREQVDGLFAVNSARSAAQRAAMAQKLLDTARDTKSDPAAQYVLLDMARDVAADGGQVALAMEAIDELHGGFQVDGLTLRAQSLAQAAPAIVQNAARNELVETGISLVDELFAADKYVEAAKLIKSLQGVAAKTRDKEQRTKLSARLDQGSELFKGFKDAQAAIETLKKSPTDAAAALVAGRYYAFIKGDWQRGLVLLSLSSDAALKSLAEKEMLAPRSTEDRIALADAWLKQAGDGKGLESDRQRARAAMWFGKVQGGLTGLAKVEVQRKLEAIGKLSIDGGAPFQPMASPTDVATTPKIGSGDVHRGLIHHWPFDERRGNTADDVIGDNDFTLAGYSARQSPWSKGQIDGAVEFFGGATLATTKRPITREQYTIAFWLKPGRSTGTNPRIVFPADGSYNWIMLNAESRRGVGFYYNNGQNTIQDRQPATNDAWEHYAVTVDLAKSRAAIFRQGKPIISAPFRDNQPRGPWMLAHNSDPQNHGDSFVGAIDDVRIYDRVLSEEEVQTLSAAGAASASEEQPPAGEGEAIDLLALVDVAKHPVQGKFERRGKSIICPEAGFARTVVPYHPPAEYELSLEVTRKKPPFQGHDMCLGLVYQGKLCAALIDRVTNTARGPASWSTLSASGARNAGTIVSVTNDEQVLKQGRRTQIVCTVGKNSIKVAVDGKELLNYNGPAEWTGLDGPWGTPDPKALLLGGLNEQFEFHSLTLTPAATSVAPAASGKSIDLLALVDTKKNAVFGDWRLVDGELVSPRIPDCARLQIPAKVPAEYDLELEVTRNGGGNELAIGMIYQGKQCSVGIDRYSARSTDILGEMSGGPPELAKAAVASVLKPGERSTVKCAVRKNSITVFVDDAEIVAYRGDARWSGMSSGWAVPDKTALMLGAWWAEFRIHSFTLTPVGGSATALPTGGGEGGQIDLMPLVDVEQDSTRGAWREVGGKFLSSPDAQATLQIPYIPAREYDFEVEMALADANVDIELKLPYGGPIFSLKIDSGADVKVGVPRRFRCAVRKTGITIYQNDKQAAKIDRDPVAKPMRDNDEPLAIVTRGTQATISRMQITDLGSGGRPLRDSVSRSNDGAIYLDDLPETSSLVYGGRVGKHGKTGLPENSNDPKDVVVGGKAFTHAVFAAAHNEGRCSVVYDLGAKYARFRACVAIADQALQFRFSGPMTFSIVGDDRVLWTSGEFTRHGQTEDIDIDVTGVRYLELKGVTKNNICAWSVWLNPKLTPPRKSP